MAHLAETIPVAEDTRRVTELRIADLGLRSDRIQVATAIRNPESSHATHRPPPSARCSIRTRSPGSKAWSCAPGGSSKATWPACTAARITASRSSSPSTASTRPATTCGTSIGKSSARPTRFYLKQFEEETNLICYLLLDTSESMQYQRPGAPLSKLAYAQCAAAALAYLVLQQRDSVGPGDVRPGSPPAHSAQQQPDAAQAAAARDGADRRRRAKRAPGRSFTTWPSGSPAAASSSSSATCSTTSTRCSPA